MPFELRRLEEKIKGQGEGRYMVEYKLDVVCDECGKTDTVKVTNVKGNEATDLKITVTLFRPIFVETGGKFFRYVACDKCADGLLLEARRLTFQVMMDKNGKTFARACRTVHFTKIHLLDDEPQVDGCTCWHVA